MLDFNDANEQREFGDVIPDGTFVKVRAHIQPGGENGRNPGEQGLLTLSKSGSGSKMLHFEFTVLYGPHAKRKFWQYMTVEGGKVNEKGESIAWTITKDTLCAILNSAQNIDPKDKSEAARARRSPPNLAVFDGLEFAVRVKIEYDDQFGDKNRIGRVVVPGDPEYATVMAGGEVPAKPSSRRPRQTVAAPVAAWTAPAPANGGWAHAPVAPPAPAPQIVLPPLFPQPFPAATATPAAPVVPEGGPGWLRQ